MTRQRNDDHSTEFGLWLRQQLLGQRTDVSKIDSRIGYVTTNLDYIWHNYVTKEWMLIEEKRKGSIPTFVQKKLFHILDLVCKNDPHYRGLHILQFSELSPEDSNIILDGKQITIEQLLDFLTFNFK